MDQTWMKEMTNLIEFFYSMNAFYCLEPFIFLKIFYLFISNISNDHIYSTE